MNQNSEATFDGSLIPISNPKTERRISIVIIGGGLSGMAVLQKLKSKFKGTQAHFLVIEKNQDFMYHDASPRSLVEGQQWAEKAFWKYFDYGEKITATVLEMHSNYLVLHDGKKIAFDYCVVATGSSASLANPFVPIGVTTMEQGLDYFNATAASIREARSICLVGGGPSSCELAAEIKQQHPEKVVTIIHSRPRLLKSNDIFDSTKRRVESKLEKMGVVLVLGDRIPSSDIPVDLPYRKGPHLVRTENGVELESDLTFFCISKPNASTAFLLSTFPSVLDKQGFILVQETLQLQHPGLEHVFSVGDVAATGAPKMTWVIRDQASIVAGNIYSLYSDKPLRKYQAPKDDKIWLTLGRMRGVVQLPFVPSFVAPFVIPILGMSIGFIKNNSVNTFVFKKIFGYA